MVYHVRRIPLEALEVEMRIAAGEPALQALRQLARDQANTREAPAAEQGIFTRLLPMGWAAMTWSVAQRGTGDVGPAITRADGGLLPRSGRGAGGTTSRALAS